uniref:Uncharacterized protein n=1 Tax=Lactuca sativa TaxID=4236 RepID=A0A9R1VJP8_LACSA|nr:hypothetical protein LSAT_V11C500256670 [Lactuca sativa]
MRSVNEAYYNFEACLECVRKNKDKMDIFDKKIEIMLKEYENDPTSELTNVEEVGKIMSVSIPKDIDINVPNIQSNKGSGKKIRIQIVQQISFLEISSMLNLLLSNFMSLMENIDFEMPSWNLENLD